jgi:hypothetical protein
MKKIYIAPISKVREMETSDGILSVTSVDKMDNFLNELGDEGDGGDYARGNNRNTNIWDQGW